LIADCGSRIADCRRRKIEGEKGRRGEGERGRGEEGKKRNLCEPLKALSVSAGKMILI